MSKQQGLRLGLVFLFVCLFFALAVARLIHLQIFKHSDYSAIVQRQSHSRISIPAERGLIYDRTGVIVVDNMVLSSLYTYPTSADELKAVARYLEKHFDLKPGQACTRYGLEVGRFRWIQRRLPDAQARIIAESAPSGLYLRQESQRSYPFGLIGKQLVGFTDIDNAGRSGVELAHDSILAGRAGQADVRRDGRQKLFRVNETALLKPQPGRSLVLTIDWRLQEIVEQEILAACEKHNAKSAQAVLIDCHNGDILAMAHYDPGEKYPERPTKIRPVADQFEPGSIFKAITFAGLMDAGHVDWTDSVFCEEGSWQLGRRRLRDDKKLGWLGFRRVFELSSNIGTAKYALRLGGDDLYETARRFGMGQKLRTGLPGESGGQLYPREHWSDYTVAALAMGHSVAVTPLQMAAAFGAIANGGELLRPSLILGQVDDKGYVREYDRRQLIGRAMLESSAESLHSLLAGVVDSGTATPVKSPVVAIAGKTGTAEIPDLENGGYYKNRFIGSFAGFFPADRPMIAGIVLLEQPHPVHYGGWTAGPAFRKIAERYTALHPDLFALPERTLAANDQSLEQTTKAPRLLGCQMAQARLEAEGSGVNLRAGSDSGFVVWQYPPADRVMFVGDDMIVVTAEPEAQPSMIDLRGLSVRQASAFLSHLGLQFKITGRGRVVKQSIRAGQKTTPGDLCRLECRAT
ncbi:MAG: penicillin-binding transpeptidase domain-containing protein [bacterium]